MTAEQFNEGLPKELMLFSLPPTQTGVEKMYFVDCRPVSQISGSGPIEFHISGQSSDYLDLRRSQLFVKTRILKQDGSPLVANESAAFVNIPLHSLWGQVDVSLQGKVLSGNSGNYAYKAYIQSLLNYGTSTKATQLSAQLYYQDTPGSMDETDPDGNNSGLFSRNEFTKGSLSVDLIGPLAEDLCRLDRYILNGVNVEIKLYRNRNAFVLMSGESNPNYQIELQEVIFRACRVQVNPGVLVGHNKALEISPAKYPFVKTEIKTASVPTGQTSFIWDNLYQSKLPTKIVVGLVSADALTGSYDKNPFNFQPFNASTIGVYVNNVSVPSRPHKLDLTGSGQCYVTAYRSLYEIAGKADLDANNGIDRDDWPEGYALVGFQIQPQFGTEQYLSLSHQANVRLEINFDSSLKETVSCIVYSEFNDMFEIDQSRSVILS
ncbi:uncharacterized protein F54H12.2-like [Argopecten irradians]|uniref:uncharacterized protein F54H12.2-like n=1 Tax=Argopecten irradians TaxID=31199 RepID=UPI003714BC85